MVVVITFDDPNTLADLDVYPSSRRCSQARRHSARSLRRQQQNPLDKCLSYFHC